MNPYKVLGISKSSSDKDIKNSYRKLAMKYHPDRNKNGEEKFKKINAANEMIGNKENRKLYDEFGEEAFKSGFNPNIVRRHGRSHSNTGWPFSSNLNFSDVISKLFSQNSDHIWSKINAFHGSNIRVFSRMEINITLSFKESIIGKKIDVRNGSNIIEVSIPAGIKDGQSIKIEKENQVTLIRISVLSHHLLKRKGDDIHTKVKISKLEAASGVDKKIDTPYGVTDVSIPPGIKDGQKIRLKGQGVQGLGNDPGNLYIEIQVRPRRRN